MKIFKIVLAIFIIFSIAGCSGQITGKATQDDVVKIGFVGPLSGHIAVYGLAQRDAILIALDKVNAEGGIDGKEVVVIFEDSKSDPKESVKATAKLIDIDKIIGIIGDMQSSSMMAIAPIVESGGVPTITPIATSPAVTHAGDYVFRTMPSTDLQVKVLAEYALKEGYDTVGVLYVNNDLGGGSVQSFLKYFGGSVKIKEAHEQAATDFRTELAKIKGQDVDALFVASYPPESALIMVQAKETNFGLPIFGIETLGQKTVLENAGDASEGIVYGIPKKLTTEEYTNKYVQRYGYEPEFGSDTAYDAFMILVESARKCGLDGENIKECLYDVENYQGVSGTITFDENGDVDKPFSLFRVQDGIPVEIS
jgi:branched-chain amino acid transport system substrate-binding protein